jgi:tetratricopeptide (TPR) repeat protein
MRRRRVARGATLLSLFLAVAGPATAQPSCDDAKAAPLMERALARFDAKEYAAAQKLLDQLFAVCPTAEVLRKKAFVHLQADEYPQCEAQARKALEIDSRWAEAHRVLGQCYHIQAKLDEALASYELALANDTGNVEYYKKLLHLAADRGDAKWGRDAFSAVVRLEPAYAEDPTPHAFLAMALLGTGQIKEAESALAKARELAPDDATVALIVGRIRLAQGRKAEALTALERAAAGGPLPVIQDAQLARALRQAGRDARAREVLDRHLQQLPHDRNALERLKE